MSDGEVGNGFFKKMDDEWRKVLIKQGGVYAMLRLVKEGRLHYLPFINESSATERLYEAGEAILQKNPEYPRFDVQPPQPADRYQQIHKILMERLAKGTIEDLVVLYAPGMTQSLKVEA